MAITSWVHLIIIKKHFCDYNIIIYFQMNTAKYTY